ncbi:isochorismatase family protein [Shewanella sp. AS1]|uniref:isochorismatase family protein n=1 Tax=Shewanella sp. AS1 TaxID=2907626 RepID=UPI001F3A1420|nr:isochorismatase family protein [Shewanella sp. AS1]MCE9677831.1 isochorismatase family protein [Shewanella sp. AS1]
MLKPEECVLLIVDVQGRLAQIMHKAEQLEQTLCTLVNAVDLLEIPILYLEQLPDKLGPTSPRLQECLQPRHKPITKAHFSAWHSGEFRDAITGMGRRQVLLAGIETHICVYQTCRDLQDNDFDVHILVDGVSSRTLENKQLGITMMTQYGAKVTNTESLLFELQQEARGDRFKALLKMIK